MSDIATPATLSPLAAEAVIQFFDSVTLHRVMNYDLRTRMEQVDRETMREDSHKEGETKLELNVPIISPQIASTVAYLSKIFLGAPGVFPVAAAPEAASAAEQYTALMEDFANKWQWRRNLLLAFQDGAKYNLMGTEATWSARSVGRITGESTSDGKSLKTKVDVVSGFMLKRLDLYNTFWDMSVPPAQVCEQGDYAGYHEVMTSMRLRRFLLSLPENNNYNSKLTAILAGVATNQRYYVPQINASVAGTSRSGQLVDWDNFLHNSHARGGLRHQNLHEVSTLYARIIPKDLEITKNVPNPGTPQIWKFIIVDGAHVVYAERRTNAHDMLPIVLGQPREDGLNYQTKSLAEELSTVQRLASILWSMEISSSRRIIADRALFNPQQIREDDINNPSPSAKIAVRNTAYNQPLSSGYYQIPYNDPGLGTRAGIAGQMTNFANAISGSNAVQQGEFIKGNKTDGQFDTVMQNSDSRQVMMALLLEDQFFTPIKGLLRSDLLQYQQPVEIFDKNSGSFVKVDPAVLRDSRADFTLTDGLMNVDEVMSTAEMATAMQTIGSSPQLQAEYKLAPMFSYLMKLRGVKGLDKFERSDAEKQAEQQRLAALAGGVPNAGSTTPSGT